MPDHQTDPSSVRGNALHSLSTNQRSTVIKFVTELSATANKMEREFCIALGEGLAALESQLGDDMPTLKEIASLLTDSMSYPTFVRTVNVYLQMQVLPSHIEERMTMAHHREIVRLPTDESKREVVDAVFADGANPPTKVVAKAVDAKLRELL